MTLSRTPARGLAVAAGRGVLSACGPKPGGDTQKNDPNKAAAARGPAEVKTTAEALTKDVIADQKAAEGKYNGKVVEVEGEVEFANKVLNANGFSLKGAKKKPTDVVGVTVICNVPKGAEGKAWRLGSGQKVKVTGTATVTALGVYLADATVEPLEPAKSAKVSATDLAGEFAKDADAARKKYQGPNGAPKEIIVDGTVAAVEKNKTGFHIAKLAGADGITVDCTVDAADFAALKAGDAVTIKGEFSSYYPDQKAVVINTAFVLPKE
jgi:hypothetical protein